ncbi:MAG: hypothetical protein ACK5MR_16555 [Cumulibacter sp.]
MAVEMWQYPAWLAQHRAAFSRHPEAALIPYVRALNCVALDELNTSGPNLLFDEAEQALESVISSDGATPTRLHHLVMVLINDAQANAFSGGPNWPDQGRALDAAVSAVTWQRHLRAHLDAAGQRAPIEAVEMVRSSTVNAHLTLARVQAACALMDDAHASYASAVDSVTTPSLEDEWRDLVTSVGLELGVDYGSHVGAASEDLRTRCWYWYGPVA